MSVSTTGNSTDSVAAVNLSLKSFCTLYSSETKAAVKRGESQSRSLHSQALVNAAPKVNPTMNVQQPTSLNLNTPFRASASGSLLEGGHQLANEIKEAVGLELNGNTWWIEPDTMDVMLEATATDVQCEDYRNNYSDYKDTLKVLQGATREADIYEPAATLIQSILDHFGLKEKRTVIDTHLSRLQHVEVQNDRHTPPEDLKRPYSSADLLVTGTAEEFDFTDPKLNNWIQQDVMTYTTCLTPIDAKTIGCNFTEAQLFCQAAMYARACFNSQRHRTFVYVVMINQQNVRLYYYDHCGAMLSKWISFKDDPNVLVRMILLTCSKKPEMVGLDPAFSFIPIPESSPSAGQRYQRKIEIDIGSGPMVLTVRGLTWSSNAMHGRKTTCWLVEDDKGTEYVLKECSRSVSRTPAEWEMLEAIKRASTDGINTDGIGKMLGSMISFKVSELRESVKMAMPNNFRDRQRYFLLLEPYGLSISNFTDPMQFLCAFRDAVAGHWNLWNAGILHRDISINNILLGKKGAAEGNRGMLVDLDFAIFLNRVTSNFGLDSRTGTHAFQSYMILSNTNILCRQFPHNHLDDLESFFWVLVRIIMSYEIRTVRNIVTPHKIHRDNRPDLLKEFESDPSRAAAKKCEAFVTGLITLGDGWGPAFQTLVKQLRNFLWPKIITKSDQRLAMNIATEESDEPPPEWLNSDFPLVSLSNLDESKQDYKTFLRHIDTAISSYQKLRDEASANSSNLAPPVTPKKPTPETSRSVNNTVTPGSVSKRARRPEDIPNESPSAKRNREDDPFIDNIVRGDSSSSRRPPTKSKGKGRSTRSSGSCA